MSFEETLEFIYSFKDWERGKQYKFDLSSFQGFLRKIGSPHFKIKRPILIAGTKGKGSTAHILSSILRPVGKTGVFTSPHLVDIRERIKIDNIPIPVSEFVRIVNEMKPWISSECSTFEILTALAFIYFARGKVDFSVFEVGLGGRLDATNVVEPEVSVLTPISFDHTEILGNTLALIANEKCGIIRENGKVVSSPQPPEVLNIIKEICGSKHAKLWTIGEDLFCEDVVCDSIGTKFKIGNEEYSLSLLGRHQVINALTSICIAQVCGVPNSLIKEGLSKAKSYGRLQVMSKNPWVVFDGAHNVASAWVLRRSIIELFDFRHLILIFGVLKDKDKEGLIEVFAPITDYVFVTPLRSPRSADPHELIWLFERRGIRSYLMENPINALNEAREKATSNDLILASGSLYLVGELLSSSEFRNTRY